jgi:hypothetical protein
MILVYNAQLLEAKQRALSMISFHVAWRQKVTLFYEMVKREVFEEPLIPIFFSEFKPSSYKSRSHKKMDFNGNVFNDKLITRVPLSYTDSQAKKAIFNSIYNDISHVVYCCNMAVEDAMNRYERFETLTTQGLVKRPENTMRLYNPIQVGEDNLANVFATFSANPFIHPIIKNYRYFLGFSGKADVLTRHLIIPTPIVLYPFLILLINEHPRITESWLVNWKLYENGRQIGFTKSGNQWVAIAFKNRKSVRTAQQSIILNERSKYLIECLIKLTSLARLFLEKLGDENYEYMLLTASGLTAKPKRIGITSTYNKEHFPSLFVRDSFDQDGKVIRGSKYAEKLINGLSLTKFRASCAVKVYFETQSVHEMSNALGHEYYQPKLLNKYLPDALWNYFTNRWVRLFQNAIVYEAMKDSEFIFDAVDFTPDDLDEFINNHHFGELPVHILRGKKKLDEASSPQQINTISMNCGVFPVSISLLQWFIAIITFVDECPENDNINSVAKKWFESATLVISQIRLALSEKKGKSPFPALNIDDDVLNMYEYAIGKPISKYLVEGAILC